MGRARGDLPCTIDNVVAESAASYIRRGRENRSVRLNEMSLSWKRRIDPRVQAAAVSSSLKAGSPGRANVSQPDAIIHQFPGGAHLNKHVGCGGARASCGASGSSWGGLDRCRDHETDPAKLNHPLFSAHLSAAQWRLLSNGCYKLPYPHMCVKTHIDNFFRAELKPALSSELFPPAPAAGKQKRAPPKLAGFGSTEAAGSL